LHRHGNIKCQLENIGKNLLAVSYRGMPLRVVATYAGANIRLKDGVLRLQTTQPNARGGHADISAACPPL
jgi:hypothetical protein